MKLNKAIIDWAFLLAIEEYHRLIALEEAESSKDDTPQEVKP